MKDGDSIAAQHFAIGDIVSFEGIRRCSPAMQMGYFAAVNIYAQMIADKSELKHFEGFPQMFRYAFGNQAVLWSPGEDIIWGEEPRRAVFEDDLCLRSKCRTVGFDPLIALADLVQRMLELHGVRQHKMNYSRGL